MLLSGFAVVGYINDVDLYFEDCESWWSWVGG